MLYIYHRHHRVSHLSTNAGIRTYCGLVIADFRSQMTISASRTAGRLCATCKERHFAERRQTAQNAQEGTQS